MKIFFINPSEPLYIKTEKVRFLFELCSDKNHQMIVSELLEYCYDPSPELSRLALEMLWRVPLKIELALGSIVKVFKKVLTESESNQFINHLFDEVCVGMAFIHRRFKARAGLTYDLMEMVLGNWPKVFSSGAKCGYIYFFGLYASQQKLKLVPRAEALCEDFENEEDEVQLAVLGAVMKAYLDFPAQLGAAVQRVFRFCSESASNPDLRDRAYVYWRLISERPPPLTRRPEQGRGPEPVQH